MDDLIQQLIAKLGIDASVAKTATDKAMAFVKENAGGELFDKIGGAVPGANEAAAAGAAAEGDQEASGGVLGSLAGMASGLLGGSAGSAVELGSSLSSAGLDVSQIGDFASTIVEYLKEKVGPDVVDQMLEKVPPLKSLLN